MDNEIKNNLFDLYASYKHHKQLFEFWQKYQHMKNEEDIRERLEYIRKNKIKQRSEIETLMWILNEVNNEESNDKTITGA